MWMAFCQTHRLKKRPLMLTANYEYGQIAVTDLTKDKIFYTPIWLEAPSNKPQINTEKKKGKKCSKCSMELSNRAMQCRLECETCWRRCLFLQYQSYGISDPPSSLTTSQPFLPSGDQTLGTSWNLKMWNYQSCYQYRAWELFVTDVIWWKLNRAALVWALCVICNTANNEDAKSKAKEVQLREGKVHAARAKRSKWREERELHRPMLK